jgi:hypothetical protein
MQGGNDHHDRDEIYSKVIRAGKRTYFFDVKSTRGNDLYLTITESKKRFNDSGDSFYEKHKLFLYKEDFDKFLEGFQDALDHIDHLKATDDRYATDESEKQGSDHTDSEMEQRDW